MAAKAGRSHFANQGGETADRLGRLVDDAADDRLALGDTLGVFEDKAAQAGLNDAATVDACDIGGVGDGGAVSTLLGARQGEAAATTRFDVGGGVEAFKAKLVAGQGTGGTASLAEKIVGDAATTAPSGNSAAAVIAVEETDGNVIGVASETTFDALEIAGRRRAHGYRAKGILTVCGLADDGVSCDGTEDGSNVDASARQGRGEEAVGSVDGGTEGAGFKDELRTKSSERVGVNDTGIGTQAQTGTSARSVSGLTLRGGCQRPKRSSR